jgi:hypothetical protein
MDDNAPIEEPRDWREWFRKNDQILYGFFGWYLINSIIWLLIISNLGYGEYVFLNLFIFPINLLALIVLSARKSTRKIGLGILLALALNLFLSLLVGLSVNGVCFIPFYVK